MIGLDLWLLVCPLRLSCDRSYNQIPVAGWADIFAWLALAVVAAIVFVAVARRRSDRLIFFLAGFFGIALLPTSNLLFQTGSIMAERFLYLPSVAFAIAVVALAYRLGRGADRGRRPHRGNRPVRVPNLRAELRLEGRPDALRGRCPGGAVELQDARNSGERPFQTRPPRTISAW